MQNTNSLYKLVMIVDDTYVDRYVAERNIIKYEFAEKVVTKESAVSALEYLASIAGTDQQIPDLIFLDIRMPDVDGFGFLLEYEKLPESVKSNCLVMMLSTSLNPIDYEKAKTCKYVSRFLNKPLNKEKLEILRSEYNEQSRLA